MNYLKKGMSLLLACVVFMSTMPMAVFAETGQPSSGTPIAAANGTEDAPLTEKVLTPNGDGTYNLALSVTGKSRMTESSNKVDVVVILDTSSSMNWSRLNPSKEAIKNLAGDLLSYNTPDHPDRVRMSLVTFGTKAETKVSGTTSASTYKNRVDSVSALSGGKGGTNWEAAFQQARTVGTRNGADKYVIFISDGEPTFRLTKGTNNLPWDEDDYLDDYGVYGNGKSDPGSRNFNNAKDDALALKNAGFKFYGIAAFGSVNNMSNLVASVGENTGDHYFRVDDGAGLNAAFANILNTITYNYSYEKVKLTDGVTGLTSMANGRAGDFTYQRSGGSYGSGQNWSDAPQASFDGENVTWDLSKIGELEDGVKYTVNFTVWPSQRAYDIAAEVANGHIAYGNTSVAVGDSAVSSAEWAQLTQGMSLKTNTTAKVAYTSLEKTNNVVTKETPGEAVIPNPGPIPLNVGSLYVIKAWNDSNNPSERPQSIKVMLKMDGENYKELELNAANSWRKSVVLSPGVLVDADKYGSASGILEPGHKYSVEEIGYTDKDGIYHAGADEHYVLSFKPVNPALNGKTVGVTNDFIDLETNKTWSGGIVRIDMTNTVKGEIDITKILSVNPDHPEDADDDSEFTFEITLKDKDNNPVTTPSSPKAGDLKVKIYDADDQLKSEGSISGAKTTLSIKKDETIKIVNVPIGTKYEVTEIEKSGYELKSATGSTGTIAGNDVHKVNVTNEKKYGDDVVTPVSIRVNKVDKNTGNAIAMDADSHAVFEVFEKEAGKVGETTFENGTISFEFTKEGQYTLVEKTAPNGYKLNSEEFEVEVTKIFDETVLDKKTDKFVNKYHLVTDKTSGSITVEDEPEVTDVAITKAWNDEDYFGKYEGYERPDQVTIVLVGTAGEYTWSDSKDITEADNWTAEWKGLPKYRDGVEIEYRASEQSVTGNGFSYIVSEDGRTVTNTPIVNEKFNPVKIYINKTDAQTGETLPITDTYGAAVFEVTGEKGSLGTTKVVDGKITFEFTQPGTYTLSEIAAPTGYTASTKTYTVTVTKSGVEKVELNGNLFDKFWNLIVGISADYDEDTNTLTVENEPNKTSVSGEKVWDDSALDGLPGYEQPSSVTVKLYADGQFLKEKEVKATDNWAYEFTDLIEYKNGVKVVYTVDEKAVPGYTTAINGTTITNTPATEEELTPVNLTIKKTDANTGHGLAGATFTVTKDGISAGDDTVATAADGTTTFKFTEDGTYTITEKTAPNGYVASTKTYTVTVVKGDVTNVALNDGKTAFVKTIELKVQSEDLTAGVLTVANEPTKTQVAGQKIWADEDYVNESGYARPASITVNLLANGVKKDQQVVTSTDDWAYEFTNLPAYEDGKKIVYTVTENPVEGYTTTVNGFNITNTPTVNEKLQPIDLTIKKVDANTKNALAGAIFTVTKDGSSTGAATAATTANGTTTFTFTEDGTYKIKETTAPNGYTVSDKEYTVSVEKGDVISVTLNEEKTGFDKLIELIFGVSDVKEFKDGVLTVEDDSTKTSVSGEKVWDDAAIKSLPGYSRPESITVNLLADGVEVDEQTVTAENNWAYSFTDLDQYKDGKKIVYTVTEDEVPGYTTAINGTTITNTPSVTIVEANPIDLTIKKVDKWTGDVLENAQFEIIKNGDEEGTDLGGTNDKGIITTQLTEVGTYTITESNPPAGYNRNDEEYTVTVKNVKEVVYDREAKAFKVVNTLVYDSNSSENFANGVLTVENERTIQRTGKLSFKKVWDDSNNADKLRDDYEITLYRDGEVADVKDAVVTLTPDQTSYEWTGLEANDKYGHEYKYTVKETGVPAGYVATTDKTEFGTEFIETEEDGFVATITNTIQMKETLNPTSIYINKVDSKTGNTIPLTGNQKPAVFEVFDKDGSVGTTSVVDGKITFKFTKDGVYTMKEISAPVGYIVDTETEYEVTVTKHEVEKIELDGTVWNKFWNLIAGIKADYNQDTNTLTVGNDPIKTSVKGTKTWNDEAIKDKDGYSRPESITVYLYADGVKADEQTVTSANNWNYEWNNLAAYKDGVKVNYTVGEEAIPGYTVSVSGNNLTNTPSYVVEEAKPIDLTIKKIDKWTGKELANAKFTISKDGGEGTDLGATDENGLIKTQLTEEGTYSIEEYDAPADYDENKEVYTVTVKNVEKVVYDEATNTYKVINTLVYEGESSDNFKNGVLTVENERTIHRSGTLSFKKVWNDSNNADKLRGEYEITLYRDGEVADVDDAVVKLSPDQTTYEWTGLEANDRYGHEYKYTVKETGVPEGYTSSTDNTEFGTEFVETEDGGYIATITNTHVVKPVTPKTSDDTNIPFSAGMMLTSLLALLGLARARRKESV